MTIGNMNGPWAFLLKLTLLLVIPGLGWASWITRTQILDAQFRGEGERFTPDDAEVQTKLIVTELLEGMRLMIEQHSSEPGHGIMLWRMDQIEARMNSVDEVEREETEILRSMSEDIRRYIEHQLKDEP